VPSENSTRRPFRGRGKFSASLWAMLAILHMCGTFILDLFKSRRRLQAEYLFLRHRLNIALRRASPRLRLHAADQARLV
jgi:hypothetical protein